MQIKKWFVGSSLIWLTVISTATLWGQDDQAYPIHLHRPTKQGDHFVIEVLAGQHSVITTTWLGTPKPTKTDSTSVIRLVTDVKVLEVDEGGDSVKEQYTIYALMETRDDGKGETELLPAQTVVLGEGGETETTFTIDGKPVEPKVQSALGRIITLQKTSRGADEDQIWGNSQARHIGDKWPGNSKAIVELMSKRGSATAADQVTAESQLLAAESYDQIPCIKLHNSSELRDFKPTRTSSDMTVKHASATFEGSVWLPLDAELKAPRSIATRKYHYLYEGQSSGRRFTSDQVVSYEVQMRMLRDLP